MTDSELERYIRLYRKSVCRAALCTVKEPADADDITQDVFLKLYTSDIRFESDEHVKAWLLRCAMNAGKNLLRAKKYRMYEPLSAADKLSCRDDGFERLEGLFPLLMKLGKNNRTALYLHYYEGYSVEEIARFYGISVSAVKSRLLRGRKKLAGLLAEERKDSYGLTENY